MSIFESMALTSLWTAALLLGQVIYQPNFVPVPVPIGPPPPGPPEYIFQTIDDPWSRHFYPDFSPLSTEDQPAREQRVLEASRAQRDVLYDSAIKSLSNIEVALSAGYGHQEDQLGQVRATVGAIQSTTPSDPLELSNLSLSAQTLANAEVAERLSNHDQTRAEIRRAIQLLTQAQAQTLKPGG